MNKRVKTGEPLKWGEVLAVCLQINPARGTIPHTRTHAHTDTPLLFKPNCGTQYKDAQLRTARLLCVCRVYLKQHVLNQQS